YGLGRHVKDLPPHLDHETPVKILFGIQQTYLWGWGFVKMSMCFFLLRIFTSLKTPIILAGAFVAASTVGECVAGWFTCVPLKHWWDPTIPGYCLDIPKYARYSAITNIASDVVLYILPMRTVWNLNMPRSKKISLIALFAVGFFVVLMGFLRLDSLK